MNMNREKKSISSDVSCSREYKMEFHVHTRYSHDSILPLWLLHQSCRVHQTEYVVITDHNEICGAIQFRDKYTDMTTIVGEEITTAQGEVIGLFLRERIMPGLSARETIEQIHRQGGLVCIPHPCDQKRIKTVLLPNVLMENADLIDCIEAYNGRTMLAQDLLRQHKISAAQHSPFIVGEDAHTFFELGRNYMMLSKPVFSAKSFLNAVKTAKCVTADCLPIAHQATRFARGIKLLCAGQFSNLFIKIKKVFIQK